MMAAGGKALCCQRPGGGRSGHPGNLGYSVPDQHEGKGETMMLRFMLSVALAVLWTFSPVAAQAPTTRVRGTITAFDGTTLSVTSRDGQALRITLVEPLTVSTVKRVPLASITPGTFIGTAAESGSDDELQAMEVLVFPESARGAGEGHYAWDLAPGSTMTNANVESVEQSNSGRDLTLAYKGGSVKVRVPPN